MSCAPAGRPRPARWPRPSADLERGLLTARGLDRVLRVAWTVADLAGHDRPDGDGRRPGPGTAHRRRRAACRMAIGAP